MPVYWIHTVLCRTLHRPRYRVDRKAVWESLCFNSSSVAGMAHASKWKTWQWVRFPTAGFNLHVSFSAQNKALELLFFGFFGFEFSFCVKKKQLKTESVIKHITFHSFKDFISISHLFWWVIICLYQRLVIYSRSMNKGRSTGYLFVFLIVGTCFNVLEVDIYFLQFPFFIWRSTVFETRLLFKFYFSLVSDLLS